MTFQFHDPWILFFLLAVPLLAILRARKGRRAAVTFSSIAVAREVQRASRSRAGGLLFALRLLALAAFIVALARPQLGRGHVEEESSGVDIVLAVDLSGSMLALDFNDDQETLYTRLDIVKRTITEFIRRRPSDRIGIVAFAMDPYLVSPVTLDHQWLLRRVNDLEIGLISPNRTAIGPAIGTSTNLLRDLDAEERIIILLTDGENNVDNFSPISAAEAAEAYDIKIYTIAAGRRGKVPSLVLDDDGNVAKNRFTGQPVVRTIESQVDEETLQEIAEMTGGKFYHAFNAAELQAIYDEIDQLEKTEVKLRTYATYEELFFWPALLGLLLLLLEQLLANTVLTRLP